MIACFNLHPTAHFILQPPPPFFATLSLPLHFFNSIL
jgi:hypothetical protein